MEQELSQAADAGLTAEQARVVMEEHERQCRRMQERIDALTDERDAWKRKAQRSVRFTARMGPEEDGSMTREQIMAIPDRGRRRRAIADNIELF